MTDSLQIHCRLFEDKDMPGILGLWEKYSGWGGITEEQYYKWFINQPYGRCLIVLAEDESGDIIGQLIFTPSRVFINGQYCDALRLSAPIFKTDGGHYSLRSEKHPVFLMFVFGIKEGIEKGFKLVYAFPARGWLAIFNTSTQKGFKEVILGKYDCYAISLKTDLNEYIADNQYFTINVLTEFDKQIDALWEEALKTFPIHCSIVRNKQWLKWKLGGHLVLSVKTNDKGEKLIGYIAINKKTGLIIDVFARTLDDLKIVILNAVKFIADAKQIPLSFDELKIMRSPLIADVVQLPLFYKVNFEFAFACYVLDDNIKQEEIPAEKWFMMPND